MDSMCRCNDGAKIIPEVFGCQQICAGAREAETRGCRARMPHIVAVVREERTRTCRFMRSPGACRYRAHARRTIDNERRRRRKARFDAARRGFSSRTENILFLFFIFLQMDQPSASRPDIRDSRRGAFGNDV
ncbi:MAG: hypothetical protein QM741_02005 [Rudaea sp.]|uniref:hypothetical protein n=1 Tax=Rudaea sp. TaxID=2136325 RepID=UPI0039E59D6F